jgi:hypothetical protein
MDGSHCVALSRPQDLADRLEAYRGPSDSEGEHEGWRCETN